jgi:hypothetical protein
MNHKRNYAVRVLALLLSALFCLPALVSCKKESLLAGEPMLEIDEKGKMTYSILRTIALRKQL